MPDWTTTGLVFGCVLVLYVGRRALWSRHPFPLPPGPPGIPWIGNVVGIDATAPWTTYANWRKRYGDLIYTSLLGKDIIIINSEKTAKDLLEKRSKNYSDRPYLITIELSGIDFNSVLLPYGDKWRMHRRLFHQTYRVEAAPRFLPLQHRKSCQFLRQLFDAPDQLDGHVFEYTASIILNSTYDYDPSSRKDDMVDMVANLLELTVPAARPDVAVIAGAFPFLFSLPSWLPGMTLKRKMEEARVYAKRYLEHTFEYSLQKVEMPSNDVAPSMVRDELQRMEENGSPREEVSMRALKDAAGTAFLAASETSHSLLMTFFLMIMLNPEIQEMAQAQIDAVVGKARLPTIEDRPLLPLIDCIIRETIRYSPVVPLSIPHTALDDDVYNGFHIPKGAILLANVWGMAHDESRYPNPNAFIPERFLNEDGSLKPNDTEHLAFGFGRRVCPGQHFADTSVWSIIARVLAVFRVLKPLDENGVEIAVEPKFTTGISIQPLPFKCRLVPRFPEMDAGKLEDLIAATDF